MLDVIFYYGKAWKKTRLISIVSNPIKAMDVVFVQKNLVSKIKGQKIFEQTKLVIK